MLGKWQKKRHPEFSGRNSTKERMGGRLFLIRSAREQVKERDTAEICSAVYSVAWRERKGFIYLLEDWQAIWGRARGSASQPVFWG